MLQRTRCDEDVANKGGPNFRSEFHLSTLVL